MSKAYFISDVHLGLDSPDNEREKQRRLCAFLDDIMRDANRLFIVGDLFDAWIEYHTVIPKGYHRVLTKLEDIARRNIAIDYIAGNHDFWMKNYFRDELGIQTHSEPFDVSIDGKKILIHHGDGLAINDAGYRILKKVLRHPINIKLYTWLHPDIGLAIARSSSRKSRHYTSNKNYGEEDGMVKFASLRIQEGYDIVIMGHRHQPMYKQIGDGVYINLGDWIAHNTYAVLHDGSLQLESWKP